MITPEFNFRLLLSSKLCCLLADLCILMIIILIPLFIQSELSAGGLNLSVTNTENGSLVTTQLSISGQKFMICKAARVWGGNSLMILTIV